MRMAVRSRTGNAFLGVVGVVYVIAAVTLLAYAVVQTWAAQSLIDYAVQLVLIVAAAVGAFFVAIAVSNLGLHPMNRLSSIRTSRHHQRAAATRS